MEVLKSSYRVLLLSTVISNCRSLFRCCLPCRSHQSAPREILLLLFLTSSFPDSFTEPKPTPMNVAQMYNQACGSNAGRIKKIRPVLEKRKDSQITLEPT